MVKKSNKKKINRLPPEHKVQQEISYEKPLPEYIYILISFAIGTLFSLYLFGNLIIHPTQINLPWRDMDMGLQAWLLYRQDTWHWPLWYTTNIMYPLGTYMIEPLLLLILKILSPVLPKIFVYFGYTQLINLSLQFYVSFCLFRVLRNDKILAFIGSFFVLGASFLIWRILAHYDLTCQWLILLAFLLIFKEPAKNSKTDFIYLLILLFFTTGFAHPYIPFMIFAIGIGMIFKLVYQNHGWFKFLPIAYRISILSLIFIGSYYFFSYLSMGNTMGTGFGQNQAPLLGYFYPLFNSIFTNGWTLTSGFLYYEGECYLGLGVILLLLPIIFIYPKLAIRHILDKKYIVFGIMLVIMFLYSLSNVVMLSIHTQLFTIPLPDIHFIKKLCETLQSSGRFTWPLGYMLIIGSIVLFYDFMRQRKKLAYIVLSTLLVIQVADLSKLYASVHDDFLVNTTTHIKWNDDLHDKFWYTLDSKYKHLILLDTDHEKFAYLAALNNMTINMFYLARYDQAVWNMQKQQFNDFLTNKLEDDSIYIISQRVYDARQVYLNLSQCKNIDNYIVCSKDWH